MVVCATACATASPALAPARVLEANRLVLDVGTAYQAPLDTTVLSDAREAEARLAAGGVSDADRTAVLRASRAYGLAPPGVASYVAGRVGIGARLEGSIAMIGRSVRIGLRRALLESEGWTFSGGVDGRFAYLSGATDGTVPGLTVREAHFYGGDVLLAVGRTSRNLYDLWFGLRAGAGWGDARLEQAHLVPSALDATALRIETGAVLGLRVGFGHLAAAIELEACYAWVSGSDGHETLRAGSLALVPAGALSYQF